MEDQKTKPDSLTYNQAISEIENILREMQSENCDIDQLAHNTARAAELIEECRRRLTRTEQEVQKIISAMEQKQ